MEVRPNNYGQQAKQTPKCSNFIQTNKFTATYV